MLSRASKRILPLLFFFLPAAADAETISGKVIGISDGDTYTILNEQKQQIKIRLQGVDCPEKAQAYGAKAKQLGAQLAVGKTAEARILDTDPYGPNIGQIIFDDI